MSCAFDDEDDLPPYIGARIVSSLHRHFDEEFGPGYLREQPAPPPHKEPRNERQ